MKNTKSTEDQNTAHLCLGDQERKAAWRRRHLELTLKEMRMVLQQEGVA